MKRIACKSIVYIPAGSENGRIELDVPFVPTPQSIVESIFSISHIKNNDILYDLGCGDGRVVITAAQKIGINCTGVDLDPRRIEECRENATRALVTQKVTFLQNNLFNVDLSKATVVFAYLLSNVNLRLRSKLLKELKPGSRVISLDFNMDDWIADSKLFKDNHTLFLWTIPANISGIWEWCIPYNGKSCKFNVSINQRFQIVNATVISPENTFIKSVSVSGKTVEMRLQILKDELFIPFSFSGNIEDMALSGIFRTPEIPNGIWKAERAQSSIGAFF